MLIGKISDVKGSEITPRETFMNRRGFVAGAVALGAGVLGAERVARLVSPGSVMAASKLTTVKGKVPAAGEQVTPQAKATTYNNFYEFGTDKSDPAKNAHTLRTRPWTVAVEGLVQKPLTFDVDTIMRYRPLEERTYRFRCVEAWSMVVPWVGYSLSEFIKACNPLPSAKFVQFISLADRKQMPEMGSTYDWPYSEGLRMDEAMHPLTTLTFGAYGEELYNQQGAPMRLIVPWKYGFKNAKSIVKIRFTEKQPKTLWNEISAEEYGFYSNVNPTVDHPRWSQAHERRIDASILPHSIPTKMFNGYGDQVASMYNGMDLKKQF